MANAPKDQPQEEEIKEEVTAPVVAPPEPPAPEQPEETEQEEPAVAEAPAEEEGEEQTPPQVSNRKAKRLEKLEGLVERLKGSEAEAPKSSEGINYREMIDAPDEVIEQLETRSKEYGTSQFNAGLEQSKSIQFHTRLEIDAPRVEAKYPIFDKESPDFNPAVADSINKWYLTSVGYDGKTDRVNNANVRYADFVEGIMELADNMAGEKNTQSVKNITKQAATTGLRPDGSVSKKLDLNKAPQDMSTEELYAALGQTPPKTPKN